VQSLLDRIADLALLAGGRLLVVVAVALVLVVVYLLTAAVLRLVASRAAMTPLPGEAALPPPERAMREAVRRRRLETVVLFATRLARGGLIVLGAIATVSILVPELIAALGPLGVALGAAVGAALGFGAQQLVRDYLNGILILGENPFSVGDVVEVAGIRGTVEEVGLRRTVVRGVDGAVHSVPNGAIVVASNFTRTLVRVNERFTVVPDTNLDEASRVLEEVCADLAAAEDWGGRFVEPPSVVGVEVAIAGEPGIPILVTATVRPAEKGDVVWELRRRASAALRAAGIELAAGWTSPATRPPEGVAADAEGGADFT
jgi:small conductance mechanosensitive channel